MPVRLSMFFLIKVFKSETSTHAFTIKYEPSEQKIALNFVWFGKGKDGRGQEFEAIPNTIYTNKLKFTYMKIWFSHMLLWLFNYPSWMQTGMDGGRVSILYTFKSDQTITTIYLVIVTGLRMFSALGACLKKTLSSLKIIYCMLKSWCSLNH